jgi:hypothetical protein
MCDEASDSEVRTLRGQIARLSQSGLDNATAQLLLSRKRAELEDLIKRGRADARSAPMVRPQRG